MIRSNRSNPLAGFLFIAAFVCLTMLSQTSRADDNVDNPIYKAWAKFKPGATVTLTDPNPRGPDKMQLKVTWTLVSVADDKVTIEEDLLMLKNGKPDGDPTKETRSYPAKTAKANVTDQGTEDVKALEKTFSCKIVKLTDGALGEQSAPTVADLNDDVPGGIVKMVEDEDGEKSTFVLTAMDTKN